MGLKKYEIITVGSDKRVRALRSWQVGDRYVNIGDVGGIVYDEKTLSQDGACWLFRGNFGFPGARIGGDSIVDVGEATLSATGAPNVDILGSSVVVGSKLRFESETTTADAVVLTAKDFEQGSFNYAAGVNWETMKATNASHIRSKAPIFSGGAPVTVKCAVEGYAVTWYTTDADGITTSAASTQIVTGAGVSFTVPAGQYFLIRLRKEPIGGIVPADATTAKITFTGTYKTRLSIIDSRVEVNPATSAGVTIIRPGGTQPFSSGNDYPEAIIRNSKVSINVPPVASISYRMMGQIIGSDVTIDATAGSVTIAGIYSNIKNLMVSGVISSGLDVNMYNSIQATDCDNFAVSATVFPGLGAAQTAGMPFIFQGCNVPNGIFYHHAQIANTYKNIDFAKAQADLGKPTANAAITLASSEVEGMYRLYSVSGFGALAESQESVKALSVSTVANSYGTTIYKDAYLRGLFDIAGTNVFGNKVRSHPMAQVLNVQPRAVRGGFDSTTTPLAVVPEQLTNTVMNVLLRINGANGLKVENVPAGVRYLYVILDANLEFVQNSTWKTGTSTIEAALLWHPYAMIQFNRESGGELTPADLAGVTVTVYNGCKIVNTGETAVPMKGNIRVEDNATLINASITGSAYFGGNSVASGLATSGCVFMKDNATFVKNAGAGLIRNLKMTDNGRVTVGDITGLGVLHVTENAVLTPSLINLTECDLFMSGNASVTAGVSIGGVLTMKDNAKVNKGTLTAYGDITLCGSYNQTTSKSWTGKRVIDNENAPEYDNNVKTQYDF
nr:MAG: protein of unknown function DUF4954 [Bacteriophage sp.]